MTERRTRRTGFARFRPLIPLITIWSAGFVLILGVVLQRQVPYDELLLDPNNLAGVPWYTGLVSNLGVLGWATATVTGFFGAWIAHYGGRPAASRMLTWGATLGTLLLLDDLFQLHVMAEPLFGVSKIMVYLLYLAVAASWTLTQRKELRRTRFVLLVAAAGAFAVSIGVDQVARRIPGFDRLDAGQILLIEDAAKFLGVLAWAQFFVLTSGAIVTSIFTELRAKQATGTPEPAETGSADTGVLAGISAGPDPTTRPANSLAAVLAGQRPADASSSSSSA